MQKERIKISCFFNILVLFKFQDNQEVVKRYYFRQLDQNSPWEFIIYCYGVWQSKFDLLKKKLKDKIVFIKGVPEDDDRKMIEEFLKAQKDKTKGNIQTIIIFDDLMEELKKSEYFAQLYYSGCHHLNVSICCLTQNIFNNRTARLNCHYLQIHNFESDKSTVMNLGKQLMPNSSKKFVDMYNEALVSLMVF